MLLAAVRSSRGAIAAVLTCGAVLAAPSFASTGPDRSWTAEKCERYRAAWSELRARRPDTGLSRAFLEEHAAFLDSGCTVRAVCPRSPEELAIADMLTVAAMNAGMASTFLPFACR